MSDPNKDTGRAVDDESEVVQQGNDPNASHPEGTDSLYPTEEEKEQFDADAGD